MENNSKMSDENLSLFALYTNYHDFKNAVRALRKNGFSSSDIMLFKSTRKGHKDFVYRQVTSLLPGTFIGAVVGVLVVETFSLLAETGASPVGPYYYTLLGIKSPAIAAFLRLSLGLVFGAICGALAGIGSPRTPAKRYAFYLKEGGYVLGVHLKSQDENAMAVRIIQKTNGQDMNVLNEHKMLPA